MSKFARLLMPNWVLKLSDMIHQPIHEPPREVDSQPCVSHSSTYQEYFKHPEVLISDITKDQAEIIFDCILQTIKAGKVYQEGDQFIDEVTGVAGVFRACHQPTTTTRYLICNHFGEDVEFDGLQFMLNSVNEHRLAS